MSDWGECWGLIFWYIFCVFFFGGFVGYVRETKSVIVLVFTIYLMCTLTFGFLL